MNEEELRLRSELAFMYDKYKDLCEAYKSLAEEKNGEKSTTKSDMSHMSFMEEDNN